VTSSAPLLSTGPSRLDADDSFTSHPQAMPPPSPTAKPFRSTMEFMRCAKMENCRYSLKK
jgi:hypothetical protein